MTSVLARAAGTRAGARRRSGGGTLALPSFITSLRSRSLANTTNVLGALTGVLTGDILIAFVGGSSQTSTITPPAGLGWTQLADSGTAIGGDAGRTYMFTTTATSVNQAGGTWSWTSTAGDHWLGIVAYRHVQQPTAASIVKSTGASKNVVAPSATSLAPNAVAVFGCCFTSGASSPSWTGGMTNRLINSSAATDGQIMEDVRATAGATGTRTFSVLGSTPGPMSAGTVILEPYT